MTEYLTKEKIAELFKGGLDCSQVVLMQYAGSSGLSEGEAAKIGAAFGGGMGIGETCGAVTGAMIALGIKYGNSGIDQQEAKQIMRIKRSEFISEFKKAYPSCLCRDVLGYDIADPEQLSVILEKNLLFDKCPEAVILTLDILEKIY